MLRSTLLRANRAQIRAIALRSQTELLQRSRLVVAPSKRFYSEKKPDATKLPILPGSDSTAKPDNVPIIPNLSSPVTPNTSAPPPQAVPKLPLTPEEVAKVSSTTVKANPASTIPPLGEGTATVATPPVTPKKKRRFLRFLVNLFILSTLGYGLGVYYALTSDNWHDFFTEYVPFGEDVVAYFEEREFRKRFLNRPRDDSRLHTQVRGEPKVTIPGRAGMSATAVDANKVGTDAHKSSVIEAGKPHPQTVNAQTPVRDSIKPTDSNTHKLLPSDATTAGGSRSESKAAPAPAMMQPVKHIDNLNIDQASEPVVQDIVKIINDIITVVNADNAAGKYGSTIDKAKGDLSKVIADLEILKGQQKKKADEQVKGLHEEFDQAAKELLGRTEEQMQDMEVRWRDEFETERSNLTTTYDQKLDSELASAKQVYDEMVKNELLKQKIALKREFTEAVQETVEKERDGRLSKLDELSSNVSELERLTGEWNKVVDSTMHTQHLLVAVESVRSLLDKSDRPRPFIAELAALKEVAAENPIVNAAIASINPVAYQRGIPTSGQLIDRFRRVASEVRKASLLPDNAGVASHAASLLLSKVMFKKGGLPVGDDVESILSRAEVLLEEGNLEDAVREVNALSGWAKTLSRDWLSECRRVLEVQQALDVIGTEARLRSLLVE